MYPNDYWDNDKQGKPYLPPKDCFVVMNGGGIFFLMNNTDYYPSITNLSDVLGKYDVVWKGE